jgi:Skp family chaperone for outer membrane proteins
VRRNLLVAVLVGTGLTFTLWGASAAQNTKNGGIASGGAEARVGLIDVAYIFKNYSKFTRLYNALKDEVRLREKDIADAQTELKVLMNQKQQLTNPESPDYKKLETKIVQKKGELELAAENARREFTQKEANLYHQTYQEVETMVAAYAEQAKLTLVLRASRDNDSATNNPQDVVKEVSQMVIYSLPNMDITQPILNALNAQDTGAQPKKTQPISQEKGGPTQNPRTADERSKDPKKPAGASIKK